MRAEDTPYIKGVISNPEHPFHYQPQPTHHKHRHRICPPFSLSPSSPLSFSHSLSLPFGISRPCSAREETGKSQYGRMFAFWALHVTAFLCSWALASSSIMTPLKDDGGLRIFKEPQNEFEYMLKRHGIDDRREDADSKDSKERRSTSSSSFIRFGRGQSAFDNSVADSESDSKVNRYPRWKSPDIVIRFGRSGFKTAAGDQHKRGRNDLNFIRFGRNIQVVPADLDLSALCAALLSSDTVGDAELHPDVSRLLRLCNNLNKMSGEISLDAFEDRVGSRDDWRVATSE